MSPDGNRILYRRAGSGFLKKELQAFANQLRTRVAGDRSFNCLLTDDRELERLNRMFLGHDYPTDVLSFPSAGGDEIGELAISVDRAREQAAAHGHSLDEELRILMLHGVLHLMGMDHETDRGAMRKAETRWRREFGLPSGLIERSKSKKGRT